MEFNHLAYVHAVDMIGAEHRHQIRGIVVNQIKVLKNCVCRSLIPTLPHPHLCGNGDDEMVTNDTAQLPTVFEMLDQRLRPPLDQDVNRVYLRIDKDGWQ